MAGEGKVDTEIDDIIYPSCHSVFTGSSRLHRGDLVGRDMAGSIASASALYWLRIFAIGAGYHRYFSHRAYSTGRAFQFVLAFLAQSSAQKERAVVGGQAPASPSAFRYP